MTERADNIQVKHDEHIEGKWLNQSSRKESFEICFNERYCTTVHTCKL